jgi:hypothetical protein
LCIFDIESEKIITRISATDSFEIARQLSNGTIYAAHSGGVFLFDVEKQTCRNVACGHSFHTCIELKDGTLLCETDTGMSLLKNNFEFEQMTIRTPLITFFGVGDNVLISHTNEIKLYDQSITPKRTIGEGFYYMFLQVGPGVLWGLEKQGKIVEIDLDKGTTSTICAKGEAYYAILLSSGNIAVALANGNILVLDPCGTEILCIKEAIEEYTTAVVFEEIDPDIIVSNKDGWLYYWCTATGECLKKVELGGSLLSILFFK